MTILSELAGTHPSADHVYDHVKMLVPEISRATVYRILNQITDQGKLLRVRMQSAADRFDDRLTPHAHMCCLGCGTVMDVAVDLPVLDSLCHHVPEEARYVITGYDMLFKGYCEACEPSHTERRASV